jgi:hypothetical protein
MNTCRPQGICKDPAEMVRGVIQIAAAFWTEPGKLRALAERITGGGYLMIESDCELVACHARAWAIHDMRRRADAERRSHAHRTLMAMMRIIWSVGFFAARGAMRALKNR